MSAQPGARRASELDAWVVAQTRISTAAALSAISATHLVMERPGFAQRVVPRPGSVLASPAIAHYDPEPDYFFHWFRDSAIVIDALRVALHQEDFAAAVLERLGEFVEFSLTLRSIEGATFLRHTDLLAVTQPAYRKYLRPEAEWAAVPGAGLVTEARVNADGTPDFLRWGRPQFDGAALRYITLLRWERHLPQAQAPLRARLGELSECDLSITLDCADEPCVDIWEERSGYHYYTQLVQAETLRCGAAWCETRGQRERASRCRAAQQRIAGRLEGFWDERLGFYRAHAASPTGAAGDELDISVILAVLHAGRSRGAHSVLDPRVQSTLSALEDLFGREYPINRGLPAGRAPAMGRYGSDRYYGGGAWFIATLAAAELYFRLAAALAPGEAASAAFQRGESFLRTVQAFAPAGGELSEQFDRTTGAATSARHLSWSYAAFITAAASRAQALRHTAS